jgi:hypothetical protein
MCWGEAYSYFPEVAKGQLQQLPTMRFVVLVEN